MVTHKIVQYAAGHPGHDCQVYFDTGTMAPEVFILLAIGGTRTRTTGLLICSPDLYRLTTAGLTVNRPPFDENKKKFYNFQL